MKIVFFGTPEFSVKFLSALNNEPGFQISAVVCQSDKPVGRKKVVTAPDAKVFALDHKIPVIQPANLKQESSINEIKSLNADLFVVVAYGKIIPQAILDLPKLGCINVHPSLLPKYRGPSPIQSVILNQESETGVSIMLLDYKMDHGPILAQTKIKLSADEIPESLREKVVKVGAPLLINTIKHYANKAIKPKPQDDSKATICKLLTRDDGLINWNAPAQSIYAQIRALTPWPGTHTAFEINGQVKTLKIISVNIADINIKAGQIVIERQQMFIGTETKALEILELQEENGSRMKVEQFIQGHRKMHNLICK